MDIQLTRSELKEYLGNQLETFFPDKYKMQGSDVDTAFTRIDDLRSDLENVKK